MGTASLMEGVCVACEEPHEPRGAREGCASGRDLPEQFAIYPAGFPIDIVCGSQQGRSQFVIMYSQNATTVLSVNWLPTTQNVIVWSWRCWDHQNLKDQ